MRRTIKVILGLLATASIAAAPPAPQPPHFSPPTISPVFDIRSFSAVGDGATLNTKSIQTAIDACTNSGGGTVLITGGKYLTGTLYLKSNVTLHIDAGAVLLASTAIADYATDTDRTMYAGEPYMNRCLVFVKDATNVSFEGQGAIDGQGKAFPEPTDRQRNRPKLIRFLNSNRIRMRDISLLAPASWTTEWRYCNDIAVDGITITTRANHNGDGLDFDGCTKVRVSNSTFDTDDDSLCLQTSLAEKPCKDITIMNCHFCSEWAGIRIGLLSRGDFDGIAVTNCTFRDCHDAGLKIQNNEGAEMKNMSFTNLIMNNVARPVFLTFCQKNAWVDAGRTLPPMKRVSNLQFSNIVVDSSGITGPAAKTCGFQITGLPDHPIENITFSDIRAIFPGTGTAADAKSVLRELTPDVLATRWPEYSSFGGTVPSFGFYARHVKGLTLRNIDITTAAPDERPPIVFLDVTNDKLSDTPAPDKR